MVILDEDYVEKIREYFEEYVICNDRNPVEYIKCVDEVIKADCGYIYEYTQCEYIDKDLEKRFRDFIRYEYSCSKSTHIDNEPAFDMFDNTQSRRSSKFDPSLYDSEDKLMKMFDEYVENEKLLRKGGWGDDDEHDTDEETYQVYEYDEFDVQICVYKTKEERFQDCIRNVADRMDVYRQTGW
jgi:hypothetical protein